jgi:L-ascorbate metabolism protein UlaG (beta-lactamase superfamily)
MEIRWHGYSCFSIKSKQNTIVIDPYDNSVGLKLPALKADVLLVSHDHEGHNNTKAVAGEPKIINWPGEYEIRGIAISALQIPYIREGSDKKMGHGLLFTINMDNLRLCFLGDLGGEINDELIESIGDVDVLMIPIGGHHTMDAKQAHLVIEELEPRAIIPMHYATPGVKSPLDGVEPFLKLIGSGNIEPKDQFEINNRADLKEDKTEFVILKPQTA